MIRFIFTGAQGTGKTTILNHFRENGVEVITEVVRKLSKEGIQINEQGDAQGQQTIFDTYTKLLAENKTYISDRGLTDVLAYTMCLVDSGRVPMSMANEQLEHLKQFAKTHKDIVYFYFPIEFKVVDDGVRSTDEAFRTKVDRYIIGLLKEVGLPYVEVRGTVEERIKIVEDTIALTEHRHQD